MKPWYKSMTLWTNIGIVLVAVGTAIQELVTKGDLSMSAIIAAVISVANIVLRLKTTTAVSIN